MFRFVKRKKLPSTRCDVPRYRPGRQPRLIESPVGEGFPVDVAKDGRILAITRGQDNRTQLVIVSNWEAGLKK